MTGCAAPVTPAEDAWDKGMEGVVVWGSKVGVEG